MALKNSCVCISLKTKSPSSKKDHRRPPANINSSHNIFAFIFAIFCPFYNFALFSLYLSAFFSFLLYFHVIFSFPYSGGYGHAAWTWTYIMDTAMQHEHGHAALTLICSMDMDMHLGHAHWICSCRDMNIDYYGTGALGIIRRQYRST
jgi:hypothetical protein